MAEKKVITVKNASLGYAEVGATTFTELKGIMEGLVIEHDADTLTPTGHEFSDNPLLIIPTGGQFKIIFDLVEFTGTELAALDGGTYTDATKVYVPADAASIVLKAFKLSFKNGMKALNIYNGQVTTNWDGADLKNTPLKLHVTITALAGEDGKSYDWLMDTPE